jgi:cell division protein FtsN
MPKNKKHSGVTLTKKELTILAACVVAIAIFALLAGYVSGKLYDGSIETSSQSQPVSEPTLSIDKKKVINPDIVQRETSTDEVKKTDFTFHEKLKSETAPADKPLPKAKEAPVKAQEQPVPKQHQVNSNSTTKAKETKPKTAGNRKEKKTNIPAKQKAVKKQSQKKPVPKTTKSSAAKPSAKQKDNKGKLTVQVGSFRDRADAKRLSDRLRKKYLNVYMRVFKNDGATWYRVRVGVFSTQTAAKRILNKIKIELNISAIIVKYN